MASSSCAVSAAGAWARTASVAGFMTVRGAAAPAAGAPSIVRARDGARSAGACTAESVTDMVTPCVVGAGSYGVGVLCSARHGDLVHGDARRLRDEAERDEGDDRQ